MSVNPAQVIVAAAGYDSASDPMLLPPSRCQDLQNLLSDRAGALRPVGKPVPVISGLAHVPDGIAWYHGAEEDAERLLIVAGGSLFAAKPRAGYAYPPAFEAFAYVGSGFEVGKAVRSVAYDSEAIFVQEGGIQPLRYDGTGLYQLGITPPEAPTVALISGGNKAGSITHKASFADAQGRESDLSAGTTNTFASQKGFVTIQWPDDLQVVTAYIYANTAGGAVWYRVGTLTRALGEITLEDNLADSLVNAAGATTGPEPGQYAVPNRASAIARHKNRLVLNDLDNPDTLQINNLHAPTQWASVSYVATDGERIPIVSETDDPILALQTFGSVLGIWKRSALLIMVGDDPSDFLIRPLHERPCIAPATALRTDNSLLYLADDGVYSVDYSGAFLLGKVSKDIEPDLLAFQATAEGQAQMQAAFAFFAHNRYHLVIGDRTFIYQLDTQGWTRARWKR